MKNSSCPLRARVTGSGGTRDLEGNNVSLFSVNGFISEVWKTGNMLGRLGRSSVTVECFSSVLLMTNGPSNRGINLATRLGSLARSSRRRCNVERTTRSPTLKGKIVERDLFA